MTRVACIDIGTVTCRLAVADVERGQVMRLAKQSTICNLGEGLTQTGCISQKAIQRVLACIGAYVEAARQARADVACCTLTSAARDAENSEELTRQLVGLGLDPQVILGTIEGSLTFMGVSQDFKGERLLVADSGGGSTELALGSFSSGSGGLDLEAVKSVNVGARRVTERFLQREDPPSDEDVAQARAFARHLFDGAVSAEGIRNERPDRLVVTGGTATSLVAIDARLEPYDSGYVHLHRLAQTTVEQLCKKLSRLTVAERAKLPGLQAKRAPVILGGALTIAELMASSGFDELSVSERDLLFGLASLAGLAADGAPSPIGWLPGLAPLS